MAFSSRWQSVVMLLRPWHARAAVIVVAYLAIGTAVGSWWTSPLNALWVMGSLTFILFIPGYLVTYLHPRDAYDAIERATFAFLFSIVITSGVVYVLADRFKVLPGEMALTPRRLVFAQLATCAVLAVLALWRQRQLPWWSAAWVVGLPIAAVGARLVGAAVGVRDLAVVMSVAVGLPAIVFLAKLWRTSRSLQRSGHTPGRSSGTARSAS